MGPLAFLPSGEPDDRKYSTVAANTARASTTDITCTKTITIIVIFPSSMQQDARSSRTKPEELVAQGKKKEKLHSHQGWVHGSA